MKHAPHVYAKALVEVLDDAAAHKGETRAKDDVIAKNFLALVR